MKQTKRPPQWAERFIEWYCRPELLEEIQGDLHEVFFEKLEEGGINHANRQYIWNVIRSFRFSTVRYPKKIVTIMLKSDFKIALRTIRRNKGYSAIKLGGLVLGMIACILIGLFIRDELSYDQTYPDKEQIFRVYFDWNAEGKTLHGTSMPPPLARTLVSEFPEVIEAGRFNAFWTLEGPGNNQFRPADQAHNTYEKGFVYADQEILDIFQFPMLYGDPGSALSEPNSIVLSEEKAKKYFPNENPLGKLIILNEKTDHPFKITGVLAETTDKSHIPYDFYLSLEDHEFWPGEQNTWNVQYYDVYIKLQQGVNSVEFEKKLEYIVREYYAKAAVSSGNADNIESFVQKVQFRLQPVTDVYLRSSNIADNYPHGDIRFIWLFGIIAIFILTLAAINFINLTTARATRRAQEVGVRKVLGSSRSSLVSQFLIETIAYSLIALFLAVVCSWLFLPIFNSIAAKDIEIPWTNPLFIPLMICLAIFIGMLAGVYPALYMSGFRPIQALKGKMSSTSGNHRQKLQTGLVVFQFCTAAVLIICTMMVQRQMNFILDKDLGFEKDQIVMIEGLQTLTDKIPLLRDRVLELPAVNHVSVSDYVPVEGGKRSSWPMWIDGEKDKGRISVQRWLVDDQYLNTFGIKLEQGRDFDRNMSLDSQSIIVNQTFVKQLNLENPLGSKVAYGYDPKTIIGIVEDFHFENFTRKIEALSLELGSNNEIMSLNVAARDIGSLLPALEVVWNQHAPNQALRYEFMDDRFAGMYDGTKRMGLIFSSFSTIAIVLACLGLLALMTFMVEQRSKEISIRKVLGASIPNLFMLLTRRFMLLVLVSIVLALPIAWYLILKWMQDYEYSTTINSVPFLAAGLTLILVALMAISNQALKATLRSPIEAIKNE